MKLHAFFVLKNYLKASREGLLSFLSTFSIAGVFIGVAALLNHLMALLKAKGEPFKPEEIKKDRGQNLAPDQIKRP